MKNDSLVDWNKITLNALKCFGILCLSVSKVEVLERSMERKHFITAFTLTMNGQELPIRTLMDCRTTCISCMDQDFAC